MDNEDNILIFHLSLLNFVSQFLQYLATKEEGYLLDLRFSNPPHLTVGVTEAQGVHGTLRLALLEG